MNRRIYAAASRLTDAARRLPCGAFWGSIHGTLCHLLWGDQMWMARFDGWPKRAVRQRESSMLIVEFEELSRARIDADAKISSWAERVTALWLAEDLAVQRLREQGDAPATQPAGHAFLQSSNASSRADARHDHRRRRADRRHRPPLGDLKFTDGSPYCAAHCGESEQMSAPGTKRTCRRRPVMSAFGGKADVG